MANAHQEPLMSSMTSLESVSDEDDTHQELLTVSMARWESFIAGVDMHQLPMSSMTMLESLTDEDDTNYEPLKLPKDETLVEQSEVKNDPSTSPNNENVVEQAEGKYDPPTSPKHENLVEQVEIMEELEIPTSPEEIEGKYDAPTSPKIETLVGQAEVMEELEIPTSPEEIEDTIAKAKPQISIRDKELQARIRSEIPIPPEELKDPEPLIPIHKDIPFNEMEALYEPLKSMRKEVIIEQQEDLEDFLQQLAFHLLKLRSVESVITRSAILKCYLLLINVINAAPDVPRNPDFVAKVRILLTTIRDRMEQFIVDTGEFPYGIELHDLLIAYVELECTAYAESSFELFGLDVLEKNIMNTLCFMLFDPIESSNQLIRNVNDACILRCIYTLACIPIDVIIRYPVIENIITKLTNKLEIYAVGRLKPKFLFKKLEYITPPSIPVSAFYRDYISRLRKPTYIYEINKDVIFDTDEVCYVASSNETSETGTLDKLSTRRNKYRHTVVRKKKNTSKSCGNRVFNKERSENPEIINISDFETDTNKCFIKRRKQSKSLSRLQNSDDTDDVFIVESNQPSSSSSRRYCGHETSSAFSLRQPSTFSQKIRKYNLESSILVD